MSKGATVEIRPVTKEQVEKAQDSMREVIEKVNRDVAEYMRRTEDNARRFALRKK